MTQHLSPTNEVGVNPILSPCRRFLLLGLIAGGLGGAWPHVAGARPVASGVQLLSDWDPLRDPTGFLVSEKWDGVRAWWDGQQLRFRSGRTLPAPDEWLKALPSAPLDGELWIARQRFDDLSGLLRRGHVDHRLWRDVQYLVFDQPGEPGPFEQRHARLDALLQRTAVPWLRAVNQTRHGDAQALQTHLESVLALGGEGLVLHRADALWAPGRSGAVFKFKSERDAKALVVGHRAGQGKYLGMVGALRVRTPEGVVFYLGSGLSDAQRHKPPPVGSWVTYRYRDTTGNGVPRFATLVRERTLE